MHGRPLGSGFSDRALRGAAMLGALATLSMAMVGLAAAMLSVRR